MKSEITKINDSELIIYESKDGNIKLDVNFENETVWLTANQMAQIFNRDEKVIRKHINNVFNDGELDRENNTQKVRVDGVKQPVSYYNLDVVISVGYRVKSLEGVRFRKWATERIKEYIIKGYTMDDERLKNLGGGNYWKELLDRIRDIRSSEKVMYRQVLDLYATSVDYNQKSSETVAFFKMVQNKLHYAAHGHTDAEVIYERADANKPFMGMNAFDGDFPTAKDICVAKNYLNEDELKVLNNIVSGYFDFAEIQAMRHNPVYMSDYVDQLDNLIQVTGGKVLDNAGKISHKKALEKANEEYKKYVNQNLSPVEEAYLQTIKQIEKTAKEELN